MYSVGNFCNDDMKEIKRFITYCASGIDLAWACSVNGQRNIKGDPRTCYESSTTTIVLRHASSR